MSYREKDPLESSLSKLFTVAQTVKMTKVRPERLVELATAGYAPHVMIDGRGPYFKKSIVSWVKENLVSEGHGKPLPLNFKVLIEAPLADFSDVPESISPLVGKLREYSSSAEFSCVYFLVKDRQVVYVGKTNNLAQRISEHNKGKIFDRVLYVRVPMSELNTVEAAFIRTLRPPLNHDANCKVYSHHEKALKLIGAAHLTSQNEVTA